ncbi:MAG TPA: preprotein translocase subunit SecE [Chloroflexota bacterium]
MAQAKSSQSNPARAGSTRDHARRGGTVGSGGRGAGRGTAVATPGGAPPPVMPGGGGRGRRTGNPFLGIAHFVRDVRSELRKVAWPSQRETVNLTVVVIALSVAMGLFLGGTDFIFQELFRFLIRVTGGGGGAA